MKLELIVAALVVLFAAQFLYVSSATNAAFSGADGEAEGVIQNIAPDYEPIVNPIWEPPSGEIESLLFGLQAAIGALIIGFTFGYYKGKGKNQSNK
ncbi:MAG: energy-coupling factor ABC transporter substrate-binding protein [Methanohalobium sp.]|uniref:energy-coupling factor ABC transporter substrate-binding protein n=1 Tax=Methanohalobium sp. TaxID=2837493 RepID=UPI00397A8454